MKPLERLTHRTSFRTGIIVLGAMICLAVSSPSALRTTLAVLAAPAIDGASATPAAAETIDKEISLPVAITVFPEEVYRAPETWARRAYPNLTYFNEVDKGGHFAAWEEPDLFASELRAAFRSLRSVN
jgi:pimeloyl-ACP methyl ester carboxylesterase